MIAVDLGELHLLADRAQAFGDGLEAAGNLAQAQLIRTVARSLAAAAQALDAERSARNVFQTAARRWKAVAMGRQRDTAGHVAKLQAELVETRRQLTLALGRVAAFEVAAA